MRPHPRIRKTIKWGGAAVTVLLVLVWIGSGWWWVLWSSNDLGIFDCVGGRIAWSRDGDPRPKMQRRIGWWAVRNNARFEWRLAFGTQATESLGPSSSTYCVVPLWPFIVAAGSSSILAWRLDLIARRARLKFCPKCNYDRTGIAKDAVCPECGAAAPKLA
jgi:hypothetical protein